MKLGGEALFCIYCTCSLIFVIFFQVESIAQDVILSLLFQFMTAKETIEIHEAEECQALLNTFQLSLIPSVSIRSKAVIAVLRKRTSFYCNLMPVELTSNELEFVAEVLFEMAASKSQQYLSFSVSEILEVFQEIIASDPTIMQVFETFNVLDDDDFMEIQVSAGLHAIQLESNDASIEEACTTGIIYTL